MTELPTAQEAFDWPLQATREQNWSEAARRWAVLRKAYPNHPATWLQAANAHIEAGELEEADKLLTYALQRFQNNPSALWQAAELAMRRK